MGHLGLVVEGRGDAAAVPVLLRMYLSRRQDYAELGKPVAVHGKSNLMKSDGVEGYVAVAANRPGCRAVLVVLDCDRDCPASLGPELLQRAQEATRLPVAIALADRDFEDWLYASAETLELESLERYSPAVRGLTAIKQALRPRSYVKPTWQPRLAAKMDLELAVSRDRSLARLFERADGLVKYLDAPSGP